MRWQVYCVFDTKVGAYAAPFLMRTRGEAIRSFTEACTDDKSPFKKFPGDYRMFYIAEWDDNTGLYHSVEPEPVIGADQLG